MISRQQSFWISIRIVCTVGLIFLVNYLFSFLNAYIILMIDLILIWLLEPLDSLPMQILYGRKYVQGLEYKIQDKVGDMALQTFVLMIHINRIQSVGGLEIVMMFLLMYRLIGVLLFMHTKNDFYLFLFPNFFMDNIILYIFLKYILHWEAENIVPIIIISVPLKMLYEGAHHLWFTHI